MLERVGAVRHSDGHAAQRCRLRQHGGLAVACGRGVRYAQDRQRPAAHRPIVEQRDVRLCERCSDVGAVGIVVVAVDRDHAQRGVQADQRGDRIGGARRPHQERVGRDEVARDQHQIGMQRIGLGDDVAEMRDAVARRCDMEIGEHHQPHRRRAHRPVPRMHVDVPHHGHRRGEQHHVQREQENGGRGDQPAGSIHRSSPKRKGAGW